MKEFTIIGAEGFVGSAFVMQLSAKQTLRVRKVTRRNYAQEAGRPSDVVIDASGNSTKYFAETQPLADLDRSVTHRLRTLQDFPAALQVHISSVDVYPVLESHEGTREEAPIEVERLSHYGFHKWLAEEVVRHYAPRWLIVRLAGMVGPGLRKNPVHDILNDRPLWIHPDSQYQFMSTPDAARIVWDLVERSFSNEVFNVCGEGLISPREIAEIAGVELNLERLDRGAPPRVVDANIDKVRRLVSVPSSGDSIRKFIEAWHRSGDSPRPHDAR